MEDEVAVSLSQIHEVGQALHVEYLRNRLDKATVPVSDTITRNNVFMLATAQIPTRREAK